MRQGLGSAVFASVAEAVVSDNHYGGTRVHKGIGGFVGVVIVDAAAGGIPAVKGVPCCPVCRIRHRFVELTVNNGGEGAVLIDYSRKGIGEGGVLNSVKDNRSYRNLSGVRLAAGFGRDNSGKQIDVSFGGGRNSADCNA